MDGVEIQLITIPDGVVNLAILNKMDGVDTVILSFQDTVENTKTETNKKTVVVVNLIVITTYLKHGVLTQIVITTTQ